MKKHRYQKLLEQIVNSEAKQCGDFSATARLAAELLLEQLVVSRVVISGFNEESNILENVYRTAASSVVSADVSRPLPSLCQAFVEELRVNRHIASDNCISDPRLVELNPYYRQQKVTAALEVAIRINGH